MSEALTKAIPEMALTLSGKTVTVELICVDEYSAAVVFDDLRIRAISGEGLSLKVRAKELDARGPAA
jgi:hypothetical protein